MLRALWYGLIARLAGQNTVEEMRLLLAMVSKPRWTTPVLLLVGILSSLAEAAGVTLILLFFYLTVGGSMVATGGFVVGWLSQLAAQFGNTQALIAVVLLLLIGRAGITCSYNIISASIGERISQRTRDRIHDHYLSVDYAEFQRRDIAHLMETLGTESWVIAQAYNAWTRLMINSCSIAVFTLCLLALSWRIFVVAMIGSLIINAVSRRLAKRARAIGSETQGIQRGLGEQMLMTLQGMRTIRAYGQEPVHRDRYADASDHARVAAFRLQRMTAWLSPLTELGYLAILSLIVGGIDWWGTDIAVTLGAVVLLYRLQPHIRQLEGNLLLLAQLQPQLKSVRRVLEAAMRQKPEPIGQPIHDIHDAIRVEGLSFTYPEGTRPVLDQVSFTLPAGRTTALIGASGSGKTTFVNLLLRLYAPDAGTIRVDGVPLDQINRTHWLSLVGVAGQDVDLVEGQVLDNIRMADPGADDDAVIAAARDAGVAEFVEDLPRGYRTWVGQEGLRFSGGQRQRIGLARALLRNPQLMILDEAMSALDQKLEDRIRGEVARRMAGRTTLVITHRLDLVREADHIVWIENGAVRAEGPTAELFDRALADLGRIVPNPG
ncbi:ABC transporter ATP-binding protein [Sphingomonas sp. FW199]|uniref:ABC transporter ATP-binding protein n=1 Tax=Sphingomonas sp. FW199 TaxID=3400217 RepID=UPI003CF88DA1